METLLLTYGLKIRGHGDTNAEILSPSSATTTINGLVPGASYTFLLSVSDGELTANDTVSIQVANSDGGSGNGEGFTIQNVWSKEYLKDDGETVGYGNGSFRG